MRKDYGTRNKMMGGGMMKKKNHDEKRWFKNGDKEW